MILVKGTLFISENITKINVKKACKISLFPSYVISQNTKPILFPNITISFLCQVVLVNDVSTVAKFGRSPYTAFGLVPTWFPRTRASAVINRMPTSRCSSGWSSGAAPWSWHSDDTDRVFWYQNDIGISYTCIWHIMRVQNNLIWSWYMIIVMGQCMMNVLKQSVRAEHAGDEINDRHFAEVIFKIAFFNRVYYILINSSHTFVAKGPIV